MIFLQRPDAEGRGLEGGLPGCREGFPGKTARASCRAGQHMPRAGVISVLPILAGGPRFSVGVGAGYGPGGWPSRQPMHPLPRAVTPCWSVWPPSKAFPFLGPTLTLGLIRGDLQGGAPGLQHRERLHPGQRLRRNSDLTSLCGVGCPAPCEAQGLGAGTVPSVTVGLPACGASPTQDPTRKASSQ